MFQTFIKKNKTLLIKFKKSILATCMPLMLASDHDKQESKTFIHTKYFAKNKSVELTYHKAI
jgi:hypothetical protein